MKCKNCGHEIAQWKATGVWYHRDSCETFCDKKQMLIQAKWAIAEPEVQSLPVVSLTQGRN